MLWQFQVDLNIILLLITEFQETLGDHSLDFVHFYFLDNHHRA